MSRTSETMRNKRAGLHLELLALAAGPERVRLDGIERAPDVGDEDRVLHDGLQPWRAISHATGMAAVMRSAGPTTRATTESLPFLRV
jgi:hypothetical protein